jgi:hypothetical protein
MPDCNGGSSPRRRNARASLNGTFHHRGAENVGKTLEPGLRRARSASAGHCGRIELKQRYLTGTHPVPAQVRL